MTHRESRGDVRLFASITSLEPLALGADALRLIDAGVDGLHVDICDGRFAPLSAFGTNVVGALRRLTPALLDTHLMVEEPERLVCDLASCHADRVSFHVEATRYPWRVASLARRLGLSVGVALNPVTPLAPLPMLGHAVDYVHLVTTDHDFAGERPVEGILERVRTVRSMIPPTTRVLVDGGVIVDNVAEFVVAGADDVVVGRDICDRADWPAAVAAIRREMRRDL